MAIKRKKIVPKKRASMALARRPVKRALPAPRPKPTVPDVLTDSMSAHALDESIVMGDFGLVEIKFTPEEEKVLSRGVRTEEIRVLPTGQVYVPHIFYTRWLNEAFGRTGWALRPASKPLLTNNTVVVPYLLMVHGKPIQFALGQQEYFPNNKDQSYGDVLESTVASGLRRCCKHLGLGLELWDKSFNDQFLSEFCDRVLCEVGKGDEKKKKYQFRRKVDAPFWNEVKQGRRETTREEEDQRRPAKPVETAAHHGQSNDPLSDGQLRRLWAITRNRGRSDDEVKQYLAGLGYTSSKQIKRKDYDTITAAIEHPGPLPIQTSGRQDIIDISREPGEDDQ